MLPVAVVVAVALLGFAVVLGLAGARDWRLWRVTRRIAPMTPDQLLAAIGDRRGRRLVAVTGTAQPGPRGTLMSAVNDVPCVWHRHIVHRRRMHRDASGRSRAALLRRRVTDETSREPFAVGGSAARIALQPTGMDIDRPDRTPKRTLPGLATRPFPEDLMTAQDLYVHLEWIIHSGTPLYLLAEAVAAPDGVTLRRPGTGPHVVSTRGAGGVRRRAFVSALVGFGLAIASVVAAVLVLTVW